MGVLMPYKNINWEIFLESSLDTKMQNVHIFDPMFPLWGNDLKEIIGPIRKDICIRITIAMLNTM